jgi:hydroxypyruvate isomerase
MNRREFGRTAAAAALAGVLGQADAQPTRQRPVRFSFMLWALEKQAPFDSCVEIVGAAGYNGIELVGEFHEWTDERMRSILARMRSLGLIFDSMSGVKAGFAVPDESAAFLQQMQTQIDYAKRLECPQIILLSGKRVPQMDPAVQRQTAVENLKRAGDLAAKNGLEVVIEPIDPLENPTIFLTTVSDGFEIVREAGQPNVRVLYDLYHEQRAFGNLIEKLEQNIQMIGLVHIADVPGRHEPGTGEIDYTNIYRKLAALRYDRFIAMEYYPTIDPVTSLTRARQQAQEALRSA